MTELDKQYYSQAELAKELHCSPRVIGLYRKYGILKPIKIGKSYIFENADIKRMFQTYGGYDLSNEQKIRLARQLAGKNKELS